MSSINILPENVSNRIAAGEVIERPASVVKELVENSIDAGAKKISIVIEKAGSKLITITDNGSGMDSDDALLCFEQHATSKISNEDDINTIMTFGFRGEAVPSIASVSRFYLKTRQKDQLEGMEVVVHGGKFIKELPVGCAPGTEISVRDLFFNIPARKKFLKTQATEERHIQEMLLLITLANPTISFELTMDSRSIFSTSGHTNLRPRIISFFGKTMSGHLIEVDHEANGIRVSGYVSKHGFTRNTRREQRTFVNGRPVEAFPIYHGLKEGYGGLVEKGRFPPVILFVDIDPHMVDVNVHPAKREVRFRKEQILKQVVADTVRDALRNTEAPTTSVDSALSLKNILDGAEVSYETKIHTPELDLGGHETVTADQSDRTSVTPSFRSGSPSRPSVKALSTISDHTIKPITQDPELVKQGKSPLEYALAGQGLKPVIPESKASQDTQPAVNTVTPRPQPQMDTRTGHHLPGSGPIQIVGVLDETYILATSAKGLVIVDQHAAHERVLFERILHAKEEDGEGTQGLLIPITVELSRIETLFIEKNADAFAAVGFDIQIFSENTIMVNSIPVGLSQENTGGFVRDLISSFTETGELNRKLNRDAIAMASCKAAVKAHDKLTMGEAQALFHQMSDCQLPFSCPHGRPTIINIGIGELEKRFGRK